MMTRLLASCLAAFTLSVAAAPPSVARACGDRTEAVTDIVPLATALVEKNFAALSAGDLKAAKLLWSREARVTSVSAAGKARTQPVRKAIKRWLNHGKIGWTIESSTLTFAGEVEVRATVTWAGTVYDDVLRIAERNGRLVIIDKVSTARAQAASEHVGY